MDGAFDNGPLCAFLGQSTTLDSLALYSPFLPREALTECIAQVPHIMKVFSGFGHDHGTLAILSTTKFYVFSHQQ
jgi:hypothetical protein